MNKKILVIEDDVEIRSSLQDILELHEYDVVLAEDGYQGLKLAKEELPDLIICDILMPKFDGYEVFQDLKNDEKTIGIPFIYLTAKAELADLKKGLSLGADDYIVKPFHMDELISSVESRLGISE